MRCTLIALAFVAVGCASAPSGATKSSYPDRSVLSVEEINATGSANVYTAVQTLRPTWLIPRGTSSIIVRETIKVYLDGNLMGSVEYLRQIPTNSISRVRRMDGLEATQRYGLDHGQGAILVFTRKETSN